MAKIRCEISKEIKKFEGSEKGKDDEDYTVTLINYQLQHAKVLSNTTYGHINTKSKYKILS